MKKNDKDDKFPRGHAFIHMRNSGYTIKLDYREVDSSLAERQISAVMALLRSDEEDSRKKPNA